MRAVKLGMLLLLAVGQAGQVQAADEIDKAKLVGQWVPVQVPERLAQNFMRTFTKDGKYTFGSGRGLQGTYKLDGTKLTIKFNDVPGVIGDVEKTEIKKLSDAEMVLGAGKSGETYRRLK